MLTDREIASLIILAAFLVLALLVPAVRKEIPVMAKILFGRQLLPIFLGYFVYASVVIALVRWVGWWQIDLLKDTFLVVILVGLPLLFRAGTAKDGGVLVGRTFAETLGASALVLFYVNLISFPIAAELALQASVILISLCSAANKHLPKGSKRASQILDGTLGVIGLAVLTYTTLQLVFRWNEQDLDQILRTLAVSIWYPFALLPFIYSVSFYAQVQQLFTMLPFFNDRQQLPLRVRMAIFIGFRFSTRLAGAFNGQWRMRAGVLRSFRETRALMKEYREQMKVKKSLDKELSKALPNEYKTNLADLLNATNEEPFVHASFELLKETMGLLAAVAGLRKGSQQEDGLERNQAILVGHFVKSTKLMKGLIRQLADGHDGDLQLPVFREILESIGTVRYLLGDDGSGTRFDSYVNDSMIAEREFKKDVDEQVARRGRTIPIEKRILKSIAESFTAAGVEESDLPARNKNGWPSAEKRVEALGPVAYSAYRMGSNAIHGAFADVEKNHLTRKGAKFEVDFSPVQFRPQPLVSISLLANDVMLSYLDEWVPEATASFMDRLVSLRLKLSEVDTQHEIFLQRTATSTDS